MDYYVIPHDDLTDEFAKRGIPENKLLPLGIPVKRLSVQEQLKTLQEQGYICHPMCLSFL